MRLDQARPALDARDSDRDTRPPPPIAGWLADRQVRRIGRVPKRVIDRVRRVNVDQGPQGGERVIRWGDFAARATAARRYETEISVRKRYERDTP